MIPERGDLIVVDLEPTIGHEIRKARPCVVVQRDAFNRYGSTTIVCPVTDAKGRAETIVEILIPATVGGATKDSLVRCDQVRTVSVERLRSRLGSVPPDVMERIDSGLRRMLDLDR